MSIVYSKEQDGTLNVFVSGRVSREPERKELSKGSKIKFSVSYGSKKYIDCEAWCDNDVGTVAGCLEKGDVVGVSGTHRSWEYNDKTYSSVTADAIFVMSVPTAEAPMMPDAQDQAAAGAWEELADSDDGLPF